MTVGPWRLRRQEFFPYTETQRTLPPYFWTSRTRKTELGLAAECVEKQRSPVWAGATNYSQAQSLLLTNESNWSCPNPSCKRSLPRSFYEVVNMIQAKHQTTFHQHTGINPPEL
jgi:hypothetical protein